jgi:hypothetical protein
MHNPDRISQVQPLPNKEKHDKASNHKESREQKKKRQDQVLFGVGSQFDTK